MTRIQVACYSLIASALVLVGLILVNTSPTGAPFESQADASGLIIDRGAFTLMTAQTRESEQALFVLDNQSAKLLIYRLDVGKKQVQLANSLDVAKAFSDANKRR